MSKGYEVPGVDFFEKEEIPEYNPPTSTIYGIIGATVSGPFEPTSISSIKELHSKFGYAFLGTDSNGNKVISQAITAAERILENTSNVIFQRVGLGDGEEAKFKRTSETALNFTIANNNAAIKSVTVSAVEGEITVKATQINRYGNEETTTLVSGILSEDELKVALEYEGTLTDVTVPEGYFNTLVEGPDTVAFSIDATTMSITNEFGYFENTDAIDVSVLIAPLGTLIEANNSGDEIQKAYDDINRKLMDVARERGDCVVILDYPTNLKKEGFKKIFGTQNYSGLDMDEATTCFPAVKIKNAYTGDVLEASASMIMSKQMAYTDNKKQCWFAPAGFGESKGVIADAISVNDILTKEDRKEIYALRVNPVVNFVGQGIALWGNKTFKAVTPYTQESWFTQLSIRRLVNYIRKLVIYVSLTTVFEPNDTITWSQWKTNISPKLKEIKANRGIEAFKLVMDRTTISDDDILNGRAPACIYVKPIGAIEYIPVNFVLTSDGTVFGGEEEE